MELDQWSHKSSCGLNGFRNWRLRPSATHQTWWSPTGRFCNLYQRCLIWSGPVWRDSAVKTWANTHPGENLSAILAAANGSSTRGGIERLMWRRSASDIPDSAWKSKRKKSEKRFVTANTSSDCDLCSNFIHNLKRTAPDANHKSEGRFHSIANSIWTLGLT